MAFFKIIVGVVLIAFSGIEAGFAPAFAPAVAGPHYTSYHSVNIPPFASSVNVETKSFGVPVPAAIPHIAAPLAAGPAILPAPAIAPAVAPVAPALKFGAYPYAAGFVGSPYGYPAPTYTVGRSVHGVAPSAVSFATGVPAGFPTAPLGYSGLLQAPFA